jgi:general secretion pathway protein K
MSGLAAARRLPFLPASHMPATAGSGWRRRDPSPCRPAGARRQTRGSALLAALWLSAALAAIAFSLATTVRGETDRAGTASDGLRTYYLASAAVHRTYMEMLWELQQGDPKLLKIHRAGLTLLEFPEGVAEVEVTGESSKLNINDEKPEVLFRLLLALGVEAGHARETALAIEDWRRPWPAGTVTEFDQYYLSLTPSFRSRHASFQETEELLQVKGVTPDLYYGTWVANPEAAHTELRLVPRGGLIGCLSVFGSGSVDINAATPEVLLAIGIPQDVVYSIANRRRALAIRPEELGPMSEALGPASTRLRANGSDTIYTIRATARLRLPGGQLSDLQRAVGAMVKFKPSNDDAPLHILRWYDTAWTN